MLDKTLRGTYHITNFAAAEPLGLRNFFVYESKKADNIGGEGLQRQGGANQVACTHSLLPDAPFAERV